jgi:ketosteroid isomerase-like protein
VTGDPEPGAATSEVWQLADRLFDAISGSDLAAVEALFSPDVVIWHNYDDAGQSREQNLRLLRALTRRAGPFRYTRVRRALLADGFVQQHVVEFGGECAGIRVPAMLRVFCDGRQIHRIEEYVDPSPLNERLGAARR